MNNINITKIIKNLKQNDFFLKCNIPMEYSVGYPMFKKIGERLYLQVPFLRYKVTGEVDKTLVFPVKYVITLSLPDCKIVAFENLESNTKFSNVDFTQPIGFFRHDAVKNLNKAEYKLKRAEVYADYDKLLNSLSVNQIPSQNDIDEFKSLIGILLEPCLKVIYKSLNEEFYDKYLQ